MQDIDPIIRADMQTLGKDFCDRVTELTSYILPMSLSEIRDDIFYVGSKIEQKSRDIAAQNKATPFSSRQISAIIKACKLREAPYLPKETVADLATLDLVIKMQKKKARIFNYGLSEFITLASDWPDIAENLYNHGESDPEKMRPESVELLKEFGKRLRIATRNIVYVEPVCKELRELCNENRSIALRLLEKLTRSEGSALFLPTDLSAIVERTPAILIVAVREQQASLEMAANMIMEFAHPATSLIRGQETEKPHLEMFDYMCMYENPDARSWASKLFNRGEERSL